MQLFTSKIPRTIYRIQARLPVSLRDYASQMSKNRKSYDLKLHNNLILPMSSGPFHTPNGMSLRPSGENMIKILHDFRGDCRVYRLQEFSDIPDGMQLFHEHTDHYSMQVSREMSLFDFNQRLTDYLMSLPSQSKEEFIEQYNDLDDQDN